MFGFFHIPEREARRLQRDARAIIDNVNQTYREQRLREIACLIRDDLRHVAVNCQSDTGSRQRELERHTSLHREARRNHNPVALTAHTLVIIHIRAKKLGDPAQDAINLIRDFVDTWCAAGSAEDSCKTHTL